MNRRGEKNSPLRFIDLFLHSTLPLLAQLMCLTLPLHINLLPTLHIPILGLDTCPRTEVAVFGVLRDSMSGPRYFGSNTGVRSRGSCALRDELVLGS